VLLPLAEVATGLHQTFQHPDVVGVQMSSAFPRIMAPVNRFPLQRSFRYAHRSGCTAQRRPLLRHPTPRSSQYPGGTPPRCSSGGFPGTPHSLPPCWLRQPARAPCRRLDGVESRQTGDKIAALGDIAGGEDVGHTRPQMSSTRMPRFTRTPQPSSQSRLLRIPVAVITRSAARLSPSRNRRCILPASSSIQ